MLANIHILIAKTIREDNVFSIAIVVYNALSICDIIKNDFLGD